MRLLQIILFGGVLLLSNKIVAQEHLAGTLSITPATPLNGKGFNLFIHYHLNSFDEFRGGFLLHGYRHSDTLRFATNLLSLDYAKGFKFKKEQLAKFGYYLGVGLFTGKEQPIPDNEALRAKQAIFGIRPFVELEWIALPQLTLISRVGYTFAFADKASKNLELVIGARFYF